MDEKMTFSKLTDAVAAINGTSKRVSEQFLREFFGLLKEKLIEGESVKIKKIGVFKVTMVEARKSVNVVTKEVFEIPEHKKITFTPDKELADAVNSSFLAFQEIVLPDDAEDSVVIADEADEDELLADDVAELSQSSQEMAVEQDDPDELPPLFVPPMEEFQEENSLQQNPNTIEIPSTEMSTTEKKSQEQLSVDTDMETAQNNNEQGSKQFAKGLLCGFIIGVIVTSICAFIFVSVVQKVKQENILNDNDRYSEQVSDATDVTAKADMSDSIIADDAPAQQEVSSEAQPQSQNSLVTGGNIAAKAAEYAQNNQNQTTTPATVATATATSTTTTQSATTSSNGTKQDATTTTQPTVVRDRVNGTLSSLARKHYGASEFWVYIYLENKSRIPNPDRVKPGTVVVIPDAAKYAIDKNDPKSIQRAKNEQSKLK